MENLWLLNRIQNLELSSEQQIEFASFDYRDYQHEEGDVVYADPPYAGTGKYDRREFDHEAFWEWVRTRDYPVYVSEYNGPDDFACIWQKETVKLAAGGNSAKTGKAVEKLFVHNRWKGN
ncbi:MAG: DNA adenine methylase [Clostridiales bacterium]|nr:DNA adenine methylase [Clostridiales bacterium]MBQ1575296.1 DNA adenine methylase [Clostridiales bacterium]